MNSYDELIAQGSVTVRGKKDQVEQWRAWIRRQARENGVRLQTVARERADHCYGFAWTPERPFGDQDPEEAERQAVRKLNEVFA